MLRIKQWLLSALPNVILLFCPSLCLAAQLLVLNKGDASLSFIEPESGDTTAIVPTGAGPHEVEVSSDGKLAFVSNYGIDNDGNTISVVDIPTQKELRRINLGDLRRPHGLTYLKGRLYFTSEHSRKIARLDPTSVKVEWSFDTQQDGTHMVLASRSGTQLFASNMGSNSVSILAGKTDVEWSQTLVPVGAGPEGLDESPDGRELWSAHSRDGHASVIDISTRKVVATIDAKTQRSNRLKFTTDGKQVLISDLSGNEVVIVDAKSRTVVKRLQIGKSPSGILMNPNGKQAYVAVTAEKHVAVVDLQTLEVVRRIPARSSPDGMAWVR